MNSRDRPKNPAAVALGKLAAASRTPEELRAQASKAGRAAAEQMKQRSPLERRLIAQRANRTRYLNPPWLRKKAAPVAPAGSQDEPAPAVAPGIAELYAMIENASDDALAALAERITRAPSS